MNRPRIQELRQRYLGQIVTDSRSPAGNWLRLRLLELEKGRARLSLDVRREMTNPYGHIHGGMMGLILDEAIGWAVLSLESSQRYTSLNLNLDFLYAIAEGEPLWVEAERIREGKRILHMQARVEDGQGRMLALASSNLIVTRMPWKMPKEEGGA